MSKRRSLNENWFSGGYMGPGLGMDWTLSPASYTVQGSGTGYVYSLKTFDDTLQQKPNKVTNDYYIYPGCMVRGVGFNNPDKHYTGKVYRILKNGKGEVIGLYILCTKNSRFVSIQADDNLELLLPKEQQPMGMYHPLPSDDLNLNNGAYSAV